MPPSSETSAIFISDGSAEGDRLSDALRLRGHAVVSVELPLLVARVAVQRPVAIVVDADTEEALGTVERLHELPGAEAIALFFIGTREALARARAMGHLAEGWLERPVDIESLLTKLRAATASTEEAPASAKAPENSTHSRLSPALDALLREAEEQIEIAPFSTGPPLPSPEEEVEAVLPAEILAALDEPLSDDSDEFSRVDEDEKTSPRHDEREFSPFEPQALSPSETESNPTRPTVGPRYSFQHELGSPPSIPSAPLPPLAPRSLEAPPPPAPLLTTRPPLPPRSEPLAWDPEEAPASERDSKTTETSPPSLPPRILGQGDAPAVLASAIAERLSGSLCFESPEGIRRLMLKDGDPITAASGVDGESLLAFLIRRGDLPKAEGNQLRGKLPAFGRRAGAALIAHGHLEQDQLWPVLRAHAEWVIAQVLVSPKASFVLEPNPPERLLTEPGVFGGATGAEVFVEIIRRILPAEEATLRLGGGEARIAEGERRDLLDEAALSQEEAAALARAKGETVGELSKYAPTPELLAVTHALVLLGAMSILPAASTGPKAIPPPMPDRLDAEALRTRVRARLALVEEGDYFAVLGVARNATSYEIRRAYLELRRAFEPSRALTAETADLSDDLEVIVEVLDEAYEILRDAMRRERYRRAIEANPPE